MRVCALCIGRSFGRHHRNPLRLLILVGEQQRPPSHVVLHVEGEHAEESADPRFQTKVDRPDLERLTGKPASHNLL